MSSALKLQQALEADVFDAVRLGFETVAGMARHVKIRHDKIAEYAASLPNTLPANLYDLNHHYIGDKESTIAYVLTLESVNFGSGYKPHLMEEGWEFIDHSLYYTMASRLKRRFQEQEPFTPLALSHITLDECCTVFGFDKAKPYSRQLAELFVLSMQELGRAILDNYDNSFTTFVEDSRGSAERLVRNLSHLSRFNDMHTYHGFSIPFLKRAQLAAAVLDIEYERLGEPHLFNDLNRLTIFADNDVPHAFHIDGLLEYSDNLRCRIAQKQEIPSGSDEEIEIRACAGHIAELLAKEKNMKPSDIDFILWHCSADDPKYRETPSHRTLSRFY
jgi:hypothetical protein